MSRIGKKPVPVPAGVKVNVAGRAVTVEGKLGKLEYTHRPEIGVKLSDDGKAVAPLPAPAAQFTVVPATGLPYWSLTNAAIGCGRSVPTSAV